MRFDKPYEEYGESDVYTGITVTNGKHGNIPRDLLYILPTTEEPPANIMVSQFSVLSSFTTYNRQHIVYKS